MLSPTLIASLEKLPEKLQQEVLHYAEFLAANYAQSNPPTPTPKRRQAGTMQGMFEMSDDFDAPLDVLNTVTLADHPMTTKRSR
ncbi:DUF2281 domain-containing protein [Chamaesiphon sp. OTE_20_metabat_361]|uniref:type II toxin-antitoxin system VapB family antitoxin n=1 Tax=Chamaesiphon sp. OTE_20_metabat_361 TaxID=2964689 RepID=UPI00286BC2BF|nr:DUF2281 domain-containing protein [Chamaesiphon sp. OTE_20_metabat_361]